MARWEEVLDLQLEIHDFMTGRNGIMFGEGYFGSAYATPAFLYKNGGETLREGNPAWRSEGEAREKGRQWAQMVGVQTFNAEPVWVDPDMMSVVEAAVQGFVPEPLLETDLITPNGFLVLPRSLWLTDPSGKHLSWKAALWFPTPGRGINLTLFHDTHDRDDVDMTEEEMRRLGKAFRTRFIPTHVVNWGFGEMHPGEGQGEMLDDRDPFQSAINGDINPTIPHGPSERSVTAHAQLQGTWRLLTQYLAVQGKVRPPRAFAKRASRAKLPHEHVTVVRLRRPPQPKDPDAESSTVNWSHRWMVGGHWRNQHYSTLGASRLPDGRLNPLSHRQIWISPFVKGPQDLPLVVNKARVFEFVR